MSDPTSAVLTAHRAAVREIVDGLDEEQLRRSVFPSGWTVIGMLDHLARAHAMWGDHVLRHGPVEIPWPGPDGAYVCDRPTADVLAFYRRAGERFDEAARSLPRDAVPPGAGELPPFLAPLATSVGAVVAHLLEEVARHAGHLDIARELLDGRTGLGAR